MDAEGIAFACIGKCTSAESVGGESVDACVSSETMCCECIAWSAIPRALASIWIREGEDVERLKQRIEGYLEVR